MSLLASTDWHAVALAFCKANQCLEVATIEKAIRHGAAIVVEAQIQTISKATTELREKREKANKPQ